MNENNLLPIYLRDHYAAAVGGLELAGRLIKSNPKNNYGREVEHLLGAIREDKRRLAGVMRAIDVEPSRTKDAAVWLGEKLGRFKLNGRIINYSPLSRVFELEGLNMAITGKLRLWKALEVVQETDERLTGFDFRVCIERAEEQRDQLDGLHRQAVADALVASGQ